MSKTRRLLWFFSVCLKQQSCFLLFFFFWNLYWICYNIACFMFWVFGGEARGVLAPWPGIEPTPPALVGGVLTTGPPGKSHVSSFLNLHLTYRLEIQRSAFSRGPQTCGHGQGGGARRGVLTQMHGRVWTRQLLGSRCMTHGAQLGALCRPRGRDPGWEGGLGGNRCMCTYADSCCCPAEANTTS